MTENNNKPIALVTGASRGIGRAIALHLARMKTFVFINYLSNRDEAQKTETQILESGGRAALLPFDISDMKASQEAVKTIVQSQGKIDILVNNAGLRDDRLFAMMKQESWQAILDTNLTGFYNVTKPVVKNMLKNRYGRIVNIASTAGQMGNAGQVNYSAAKSGLIGATRALAREIGNRNITVNAISPGFIETEMIKGVDTGNIAKSIPCGRIGTPEDVAFATGFLCSEQAGYINGQVLGVNGGLI
jgi:3-oxoacyl-[acyl-carrier protein] reductase